MAERNLMAQTLTLNDLVNYQDGAVVSRTLIAERSGTVTLFAFDSGQELSEHTAPYDALVYVLDGQAQITISGKSHLIGTGQMIIMPANQPHAVYAASPFKMLLVMIRSAVGD